MGGRDAATEPHTKQRFVIYATPGVILIPECVKELSGSVVRHRKHPDATY